jgi:DNA sulfur modification protein DndB
VIDLLGNEARTRLKGDICNQFGKKVLTTQISFKLLKALFEVDHEVQRELDSRKRRLIKDFILDNLENQQPFFFSPFVFSARGGLIDTGDGWEIEPNSKLYILDGQHRSQALASAMTTLEVKLEMAEEEENFTYANEKREMIRALENFPVSMQVFFNLDCSSERQLFTDMNTERKDAHSGLIIKYDQRDSYAQLTREVIRQLKNDIDIEENKSRVTVHSTAVTSSSIIRRCLIALFEGILTVKTGKPYFRNCRPDEVTEIAVSFFKTWPQIFPKDMYDRNHYVSGLTGVQISLAYTVFLLTRERKLKHKDAIEKLLYLENFCTWRHNDPLFQHLYDSSSGRIRHHSSSTSISKLALTFNKIISEQERK